MTCSISVIQIYWSIYMIILCGGSRALLGDAGYIIRYMRSSVSLWWTRYNWNIRVYRYLIYSTYWVAYRGYWDIYDSCIISSLIIWSWMRYSTHPRFCQNILFLAVYLYRYSFFYCFRVENNKKKTLIFNSFFMKKIFFALIFFFITLQSYAGYNVTLWPTSGPSGLTPGDIFISSGPYEEIVSPFQSLETIYAFDPYGENRRLLCKQIAVVWSNIECRADMIWYPIIFPIGPLPYYIFDERELMTPPAWTGTLPPSTDITMIDMAGNTANGWIDTATTIMATPFGSIVYFIIGITLIITVVWTILAVVYLKDW